MFKILSLNIGLSLKRNNKKISINLNFVFKESWELISAMDNKRFPNIENLNIKRIERSEKEFQQFLSNCSSYQIRNLSINECKLSSLKGDTFHDLTQLVKYWVQDKLVLEGVVADNQELAELLGKSYIWISFYFYLIDLRLKLI